jgi:predicted phage terminase large subunit-like protein
MKIDRKLADSIYRNHFGAFCYAAFEILNPAQPLVPNWHIDAICYHLQRMVIDEVQRRLILNLPPRTLKTLLTSVMLPAWLLGRNPAARIICASYSEELAFKFSRDCRALMESAFFRRLFPRTKLNPKKTTERELETTRRGYRLATSTRGTLTGRGGDTLIVDDPIKANDANSEIALANAADWFRDTALNRLDKIGSSLIIVAMQRLHVNDLSGLLIEGGWPSLVLPAIATEAADYVVGDGDIYHRPAGELLQPKRDSPEVLESHKRDIGSRLFAAQYMQTPTPAEGNMIKASWLARYDFSPGERKFRRVVLSCDPAGKAGPRNDYTAIIICGFDQQEIHLLHAARGHWTMLQMRDKIKALVDQWSVDLIIIEDTSGGMGLIQIFRDETSLNVIGRQPKDDKEVRMSRHEGRFEAGKIVLPKEASWLADFEAELLAFPSGRHDDQVDALLLFLDWFLKSKRYEPQIEVGLPYCGPSSSYHDEFSYDIYLPTMRATRYY